MKRAASREALMHLGGRQPGQNSALNQVKSKQTVGLMQIKFCLSTQPIAIPPK